MSTQSMIETPQARLAQAGHLLPECPQARGLYAPFHRSTIGAGIELVAISGQTARDGTRVIAGICAPGESLEPAKAAARLAMLRALAALAAAFGGQLPLQMHVMRLRGYVRSTPGFEEHTAVLDAASDVLRTAWPDAPLPARTAIGVSSLPGGSYVELELEALHRVI